MAQRISDERRKQMIEWYLEADERTYLDVSFEFSHSLNTISRIMKEAGVGKDPRRNTKRESPVFNRNSKPSNTNSIRVVSGKRSYRGHRRRGR